MKKINIIILLLILLAGMMGCQKMERPALGNYPKDANPPGGPLKFYAAFDGTTNSPLMNAVDSIRANFPGDNPFPSIDGIRGKAVNGIGLKYIKYAKPNDWAVTAKSFTISFWFKHNGQTKNNKGTNGPEYILSFKSNNGHWSGSNLLVFLEGDHNACAVKVMVADKKVNDAWMTWEGGQTIPNIMDNNWHHIALVYDAKTSNMTLYKDGVANPNIKGWAGHGDINFDDAAITEVRVGAGPGNDYNNANSDDWLSTCWKGGIDQFRLYGVALSAGEVTTLFSGKQ